MCKNCGEEKFLVNAKGWCADCQKAKNRGENVNKPSTGHKKQSVEGYHTEERQRLRMANFERKKERMRIDDEVYLKVFNIKPHKCEECGAPLPDVFLCEDGSVMSRWQYSHIITKGSRPDIRRDPDNFNRLCMEHHHKWEFGDRTSMRIYESNMKTMEILRERYKR